MKSREEIQAKIIALKYNKNKEGPTNTALQLEMKTQIEALRWVLH